MAALLGTASFSCVALRLGLHHLAPACRDLVPLSLEVNGHPRPRSRLIRSGFGGLLHRQLVENPMVSGKKKASMGVRWNSVKRTAWTALPLPRHVHRIKERRRARTRQPYMKTRHDQQANNLYCILNHGFTSPNALGVCINRHGSPSGDGMSSSFRCVQGVCKSVGPCCSSNASGKQAS